MGLVRILVDGYSLLHNWPEIAPGKPRMSAAARQGLINILTQYYDATGTPVTIVFDGSHGAMGIDETPSTPEVEIVYSRTGQTADKLIERAAYRLGPHGEVLVVIDDQAERDTISGFGCTTVGGAEFVQTVLSTLADLEREIQSFNQQEFLKFNSAR
jgi:uncharacterized protein